MGFYRLCEERNLNLSTKFDFCTLLSGDESWWAREKIMRTALPDSYAAKLAEFSRSMSSSAGGLSFFTFYIYSNKFILIISNSIRS